MLFLLSALSGCAALIYEIVWFQLLQLAIGSAAVSLGLLLAAYMGGLCIGSWLFARKVPATFHPMRAYAYIEGSVALLGVVALFAVPLIGKVYAAGITTGLAGIVWRGVIAALCLLPPTILMGCSFPALARMLDASEEGSSRLGAVYSANIAGAVGGCLLAGFYLLRVYDMGVATYAAAACNLVAAALAYTKLSEPVSIAASKDGARNDAWKLVYAAIFLSGLTALGAEVVWTRLLSLLMGATVYAFSLILAVFLIGLWLGSWAGSAMARRNKNVLLRLAACQVLLVCAIAWSAYTIAVILPRWPVDPWFAGSPWYNFDFDFTRALRAIFLPTLLWGASFPLALAGVARPGTDPARFSGEVYAINTLGSILGALLFSLAAIPGLGTRGSQEVLIGLSALAAIVALLAARPAMPILAGGGIAAVLLAIVLSQSLADVPWQVFAFGRRVAPKMREMELAPAAGAYNLLYSAEGLNSSIAIAERAGERSFYVSGKSEASTTSLDMRLQRLMGHLPALLHRAPKSVLVVGFGAGVTAGSFVPYREIEKIAICELEPLIPPASNEYFAAQNYRVLNDPRTSVIYDDARHYIATARDKFDIITTDPIHPFVKGTSTLYSKEYYELAKQHLNPGGIVAQWLPIYDSDAESVKTQLATFFSVFPSGTVWSNNLNGDGYDLVLIGRAEESAIDLARVQQRLTGPVAESLSQVGWDSATELAATYAGRAQDLSGALQGAQINTDLNLRLQYLAGLGLDSMSAAATYQELMSYRRFPEGLFTATPDVLDGLKSKLGRRRRVF